MTNRLKSLDSTCSQGGSPRRQLVDVLEAYLAGLEQGRALDQEALLAAHPEIADELRPYLDSLRLLHGATRDLRVHRFSGSGAANESSAPANRQIGDYRIVREIGRGGMGIVYEAHQNSLNRRVALKILPFAAVLDQRQIARFRNEAQAAAQLHHPHIVPVFAVGQEQGVYYYAMQYIDGQSLEQAIDELPGGDDCRGHRSTKAAGAVNGSTTTIHVAAAAIRASHPSLRHHDFFNTVARLGKEAAEALQHAHEYGIIHRDVKPSNLLIDDQGKLWVTDFGLARMQADGGVTLTGDVVGTLRYMSPEQASGRTPLIDARTDVYSLGVTLYELLTRRHAFDGEDRQSLLRQIVGEEPVPPRRFNPAVPIDLETIVLSAMAKSRDERYATAQALADDLDRFLAGKPTRARRPTLADRAAKWARRHRALVMVGVAALVVVSAISAIGAAMLAREQARTSQALAEAKHNAKKAQQSFERAERHFRQARGAVDQFGVRMAGRLLEIPGAESLRRDLLVDTLRYYRDFMAEAGNDPQLRHELALAHFKSGAIAAKLGAATDAVAEYKAAQLVLAELTAADPRALAARSELGVTHNNLGLLYADRGETDAARGQYRAAIAIQQRLVEEQPGDPEFAAHLAESQANLGMLLDQLSQGEAAEKALRDAVNVLRPIAESFSGEPKYARNLAIAFNNLSYVTRQRDPQAAEVAVREAISILERLAKQYAGRVQYQDDLALCYNNLAALFAARQRVSEAIEWHGRAIALHERLARIAPAVVRHRSDLAISLNNLGVAYCRTEQASQADAAFARARELLQTLADDYPQELAYRSSFAALLNNQALALAGARRHDEALAIYPTAIEAQRTCWERLPDSDMMRVVLSKMYYNYGQSLRGVGRLDEAANAALARRDVWQGNGERLFGVAVELAQIANLPAHDPSANISAAELEKLNDEVITTLEQARESGWPREVNLATDERFVYLRENKRFAALVAEQDGQVPQHR